VAQIAAVGYGSVEEGLMKMSGSKCNSIVNELICKLRTGLWKYKGVLPSEAELARQFNASRETIRQAKRILEAANVISSSKGRGTFLSMVSPCISGSIGVVVMDGGWRAAFESSMWNAFARKPEKGCALCVTDCSAAAEVDRIVKARSAAMCYAAYGVRGLVWQVDAADISEANWPSCRDEILSIAETVGIKVVIASDDVSRLRGVAGFDVVGVDCFDCGRRIGRAFADSGAATVHVVGDSAGAAYYDTILAGMDFELCGTADIVQYRTTDGCLAAVRGCGCAAKGDSFVFFAPGMADRFLAEARILGVEISNDAKLVQLGEAVSPPGDCRIATMRRDCNAIALAALRCMIARLSHPACNPMEVLLPLV